MSKCTRRSSTGGCRDKGGQQQQQPQEQRRSTASVVTTVQPNDVLMGRGQPVMVNQGNQAFIEIIRSRSAEYHSVKSRKQKHIIAQQIASTVRSKRGLFLRKIETPQEAKKLGMPVPASDMAWAVVDESVVLLKIKQALRDQQGLVLDKQNYSEKDETHSKLTKKRGRARDIVTKKPADSARGDEGKNQALRPI